MAPLDTPSSFAPGPAAGKTPEALIFSQTVEGLFRSLGPLSERVKARFRAVGVDPDRPLAPAYPVEQWLQVMKVGVEVTTPDLPFEVGLELLGRRFVDGYGATLMGKAMLMAMRVFGPKRTLERFSRNLSTGSNFFASEVIQVAPGQCSLWINRVTWPGWYFGIIARGLEHAGASDVKVSLVSHEGEGQAAWLLVSWSEQ
jgi:uncharacterized protein (TIGR02265 family)